MTYYASKVVYDEVSDVTAYEGNRGQAVVAITFDDSQEMVFYFQEPQFGLDLANRITEAINTMNE